MTWAFAPIRISHHDYAAKFCEHRLILKPAVYARREDIATWLYKSGFTGHFFFFAQEGFGIALQDADAAFALRMTWT